MTKINISIPKPCRENWEGMTSAEKGKFCNSCQKKIFDFTTASDREIVKAFQQNNQLCGRFLDTQLNRDLVLPKQRKSIWFATPATIISIFGIGTYEAKAQEPVKTEQTPEHIILGKPAYIEPKEIEISGVVSDVIGPLPGATIVIKGTEVNVQTDIDGKYIIRAKKGDILICSFTGYEEVTIPIDDEKENVKNIKMNEGNVFLGEAVFHKKRTFFGRIFHSIGNLFR